MWIQDHEAKSWMEAQARFLLWNGGHERRLRAMLPGARFYARKPECWRAGLAVIAGVPSWGGIQPGRVYAVPPRLGRLDLFRAHYVERFHRCGAQVIAFLPSSEAETRAAMQAGFDEILTNDGILAR